VERRMVNVSNPTPEPMRRRATAIADRQGDDAVRHAGEDPDGKLDRASGVFDTEFTCSLASPSVSAVFGLTSAGLSQVSLVSGRAAPAATRRSRIGRRERGGWEKDVSKSPGDPDAPARRGFGEASASSAEGCAVSSGQLREARCRRGIHRAGRGSTSCRTRRRPGSASRSPARCRSRDDPCLRHQPQHLNGGSSAEQGRISGWTTLSVPPTARASPHDSR
jgi:hypothetical protein